MKANNVLSKLNKILAGRIENHPHESASLLAFSISSSLEKIYTHPEMKIPDSDFQRALNFAKERASGKPLAYIFGKKDFYGLEFLVNASVLIPRPETEMMVDEAIGLAKKLPGNERLIVIDLGTGSGCIPISIAKNVKRKNIEYIATDISKKTLETAKENAKKHGVDDKIRFIKSDLLKSKSISDAICVPCYVVITANLPYLSEDVYSNSPLSVQKFEPKEALLSGIKGLDHYKKLLEELKKNIIPDKDKAQALRKNNSIKKENRALSHPTKTVKAIKSLNVLLEISPEQKELIEKIIKEKFSNKTNIFSKKDLSGKWRLVRINF